MMQQPTTLPHESNTQNTFLSSFNYYFFENHTLTFHLHLVKNNNENTSKKLVTQ